jgi:hypothetical protein
MMTGLIDISRKAECNDILIDRYNQKKLFLTKSQDNSSLTATLAKGKEQGGKAEETDVYYQRNSALPSVNKKFKFDCAQISPGIQTLLSKGIANVHNKKMIGFSSFQIPQFNVSDLSDLYNKFNVAKHSIHRSHGSGIFPPAINKKVAQQKQGLAGANKHQPEITNRILRMAQSKFDETEKYKHLNPSMRKKFSEFFAVKNVIFFL